MSSRPQLVDFLEGVDPCYFPSLLYDRGPAQTFETYTSQVCLPRLVQNKSTSETLKRDELCKLAFALLLKAYIRTDSICYGFLSDAHQSTPARASEPPVSHLLKVELNETLSLLDNSQKVSSFGLSGPDGEIAENQLHELEIKQGFKQFNTVLHLTSSTSDQHPLTALTAFPDAEILLQVEGDSSNIDNGDIQVTLRYSTEVLDQWCVENVVATFSSIMLAIQSGIQSPLKNTVRIC
ncbi:hypothetical protein F5Y18DRAFT_432275 [Xylariaceae sp. FL1019]|nr:hypothetical protein F5Y18DRAFT_432275 [Xylariaceae sp. FL1019]